MHITCTVHVYAHSFPLALSPGCSWLFNVAHTGNWVEPGARLTVDDIIALHYALLMAEMFDVI